MPFSKPDYRPRLDYWNFDRGGTAGFADVVSSADFPDAKLRFWNDNWAKRVGLGLLSDQEKAKYFLNFSSLPDGQPKPLAMRYHGHQFQHYNPDLGDGRGFLYGQVEDSMDRRLLDFGTKGSGQTPYSRAGDGRLTLKGAVREALATEMLEAHGVNTSKTFCFFETGERLTRNDEPSPTRAAVLTRLSHGHIRFGTFERLATLNDPQRMRDLVAYCCRSYFPSIDPRDGVQFFGEVVDRSAELAASWMISGFVHGVLNTDNMNITGESFDYGPWRFLPQYDPSFTAAYFDHSGLYAYGRQPHAVYWNLDRLAQALMTAFPYENSGSDAVRGFTEQLERFPQLFQRHSMDRFFQRIGKTKPSDHQEAERIFVSSFQEMANSGMGFEAFFEKFSEGRLGAGKRLQTVLIDEVEAIWSNIDQRDDWSAFNAKVEAIREQGRAFGYSS